MALAPLLSNIWLVENFFFQIDSVPIWVPLTIILLIILLFWWGLTRNRIPDETETNGDHESEDGEPESAAEPPLPVEDEEEAKASDESDAVKEEEESSTNELDELESPPEPDDLQIIEGIGPKIADILADAGITTYAQLAGTDPAQLEEIVRIDAGIKVANPATWPEQAALAASADWDGLEELQNRLVAGRHRA